MGVVEKFLATCTSCGRVVGVGRSDALFVVLILGEVVAAEETAEVIEVVFAVIAAASTRREVFVDKTEQLRREQSAKVCMVAHARSS